MFQLMPLRSLARNPDAKARFGVSEGRRSLHEMLESLLSGEPAHAQDNDIIVTHSKAAAELHRVDLRFSPARNDTIWNSDGLVRAAHPQFQRPLSVKLADEGNSIAPVRSNALQDGIRSAAGGRSPFMERESMSGMDHDGHAREPRGQTPNEPGLRSMGVHHGV